MRIWIRAKKVTVRLAFLLGLLSVSAGFCDETEPSCLRTGSNSKCIAKEDLLGHLDLAAPTNSLFTLMGTTAEDVITPKTGDELMFSFLPRAVDAFGEENFAIALEVNLGLMMLPKQIAGGELEAQRLIIKQELAE